LRFGFDSKNGDAFCVEQCEISWFDLMFSPVHKFNFTCKTGERSHPSCVSLETGTAREQFFLYQFSLSG